MVTNVWMKYLPVLRIVIKRALVAEQNFKLNAIDFEHSGYKRKIGYKFSLRLKNGRPENIIVDAPLASSLVSTLLEDEIIREICAENDFQINMGGKFELTIRHIAKRPAAEELLVRETV